ncbi:hypothetical protein VSK91_19145 [Bacillus swezeyi]|uniref:hypothetical protein n=1 Tax=Bacillus swezeyi TaxID=1925020 RepID=UPI0039C6F459
MIDLSMVSDLIKNKPVSETEIQELEDILQAKVVSEVEPQPEQLEAELGLPKENIPTKKRKTTDRTGNYRGVYHQRNSV